MRRLFLALVVALIATAVSLPALAQTPAKYFAGRTLDVVVAFSNTGGGSRFWAIFADALRRQLPETVIHARFNDAGSGVSAANELFALPAGSLAVGFVRPTEIAFAQAQGTEDVHYDLGKAKWIQAVERESHFMAGRRGLPLDIATLRKLKLVIPADDIGDTQTIAATMLDALTGIHGRIVVGFGNAERLRALVVGDADLYTQTDDKEADPLLVSGDLVSVYVIGGGHEFSSKVDQSVTLQSVLMPGAPQDVVDYVVAARTLGRAFFAPPGVSDADVDALRQAFGAVARDPDFIAAANKASVPIAYVPHAEVEQNMQLILLTDPKLKSAVQHIYECGKQMSDGTLDQCDFGG
jgi:tripartite-type tricarboxylate transporter receptor subunit TctC